MLGVTEFVIIKALPRPALPLEGTGLAASGFALFNRTDWGGFYPVCGWAPAHHNER